jgi:hypothetical protein
VAPTSPAAASSPATHAASTTAPSVSRDALPVIESRVGDSSLLFSNHDYMWFRIDIYGASSAEVVRIQSYVPPKTDPANARDRSSS